MNVVLVGNPNVGKSAIFSRLTGVRVIASNYPGTTVEYTQGMMRFPGLEAKVIDVPGVYSLKPTCKAEEVALQLVKEADLIVNIIDATNLERNLYLTLQIIRNIPKPLIVILNMWDETHHRGVEINLRALEDILGVPVVATCALSGEGIKELVFKLKEARLSPLRDYSQDIWSQIGEIVSKVQKLHHRHHTFVDVLQDLSMKPPFSFVLAGIVIFLSFMVIRFLGEGLINYVFDPFFQNLYNPLMLKLSSFLGEGTFLHSVLIGSLIEGQIDYSQSFGLLTTGLYVPLAAVFPYIFSFYLVLGLIEDWGYIPRLAILGDRLFHKLGLHGYAIVPMILGLGCNVPGALATRLFTERREKFIASVLMAIAVPCMAQTAMIIGLLSRFGGQYVLVVFFTLFLVWFTLGKLLNVFLKGCSPEILVEIPPYRRPHLPSVFKKLWIRIRWFLEEALPLVLLGVLIVNVLYSLGIIDFMAKLFSAIITSIWGLPSKVVGALIMGFLRKDVAVGMLRPLNLTLRQSIVGATILSIYFPCMATFMVLFKELGFKDMVKATGIMLSVAFVVGGVLNLALRLTGI